MSTKNAVTDAWHRANVRRLARQVRTFYRQGVAFRIFHGTTNSTRTLRFDTRRMIDTSQLNRVLSVDAKKRLAIVEANVPMDQLVEATLQHNLIPPVVMEFPGITVGGGLQGGAGESSSFKYGGFNQTLSWYEMVTADGVVLTASPTNHADMFWGAAGSYGSLGVVTAVAIRLVPASQFVTLTYRTVSSFEAAVAMIQQLRQQNYEYLDGVMFSRQSGVIMAGKLSDEATAPVQRFGRRWDPWFYLHALSIAKLGVERTESIPLRDYLFRYDRGAFWMARAAFTRFGTPFNAVTRFLLDPLLHTRPMYVALQASGVAQECLIQDLALPANRTVAFLRFIDQELGIYPLWLCPLAVDTRSPMHFNKMQTSTVINVGVWGYRGRDLDKVVTENRRLEAKLLELHGRKWLYAYAYYSEREFWQIYDKAWYDKLRHKYHAEYLPSVYDKTCRHGLQPVSGRRGVLTALLGRRGIDVSHGDAGTTSADQGRNTGTVGQTNST